MRRPTAAFKKIDAIFLRVRRRVGCLVGGVALVMASVHVGMLYAQPAVPKGLAPKETSKESPAALSKSTGGAPAVAAVDDVFHIEKELLTEEEEKRLERGARTNNVHGKKFSTIVREGNLEPRYRKAIEDGVRWQVYRLSMLKYREQLNVKRKELFQLIRDAAVRRNKPANIKRFRQFFLREVAKRAADLLDGNFFVRLTGVVILSELNLVEGNQRKGITSVSYVPAAEPLLKVLNDDSQNVAIKINAARGLGNIARTAELKPGLRIAIATSLIEQLEDKKTDEWYQERLVESLGYVDQLLDVKNRKPFIIQALSEAMVDRDRHWLVRCAAAKALGRANLGRRQVKVDALSFAMVHLAHEMAKPLNKNPKKYYWQICCWNLYLAFRRESTAEKEQSGLLTRAQKNEFDAQGKKFVQAAYYQILPVVKHVLTAKRGTKIPNAQLARLEEWLKKNRPADLSVFPGLEPLFAPSVMRPGFAADKEGIAAKPASSR